MRTVFAALLVLSLDARAEDAYQRGKALYAEGDYQRAAEALEQATALADADPVKVFELGEAWRKAGNPERAVRAYSRRTHPVPSPASLRQERP